MQFHSIFTPLASLALFFGLMLPQPGLTAPQTGGATPGDDVILEMNQAFKKGDRKRLSALLPQVQDHPLVAWAAYWELSTRLDTASTQETQDFLNRFVGSYQEDRLRNEWLLQLGRQRDWATFAAEYPKFRMNDDKAVRCYALLNEVPANPAANPVAVAAEIQTLWLAQKEADEGCAAAAQMQLKTGKLTPLVAWQRARLGFENDRSRIATQAVSLINPEWVPKVAAIYLNPTRYLHEKAGAQGSRPSELVTLALIRLANSDTEVAAKELKQPRWQTLLSAEERSWVWGVIGKRAARRLSDESLPYFAQGQDGFMHSEHLAWKARAALRAGAWAQVEATIAAMDSAQAQDPTWIYWRARALMTLKTPAASAKALALYQSIASIKGFYEQLALEELGRPLSLPPAPAAVTAAEKEAALSDPGLRRALTAIDIGLRSEGVREWNYAVSLHQRGGMSDRELLAAAQVACDKQVWDRCINTSERTKTVVDIGQRFPMPYRQEVLERTAQIGLDPAYVYGLIRQESRFVMDAKSSVGASGLMQVMPATARWTAKKIGLTEFKPHHITERETNIAIGTGYLKLVLDSFGGSLPLAAAAYNAGPSRSRSWRGQDGAPTLEAAIWAENVPFSETRDYVKKVLSNTTNYATLISGKPQSLKARLGMVGPVTSSSPAKTVLAEELP
jgi:soluble lytic murein transglycosylase